MKYIGSGLWAIAAAYSEANANGMAAIVFAGYAAVIAIWGSNKSLVTINNKAFVDKAGDL